MNNAQEIAERTTKIFPDLVVEAQKRIVVEEIMHRLTDSEFYNVCASIRTRIMRSDAENGVEYYTDGEFSHDASEV